MMQFPEPFVAELAGKPLSELVELMARRTPELSGKEDLYP